MKQPESQNVIAPQSTLDKSSSELAYWKRQYEREGGKFLNSWYSRMMLAMAGEADQAFLSGKVVADFGCGPRGSLEWIDSAKEKIGIDVLADLYTSTFDLTMHSMRYLTNTELEVPLPNNYVDVLYTLNAIDHVDHFEIMCQELLRVLKPGGDFIGSFNLNEPATPCEPQTLDEDVVNQHLLRHLNIKSYRLAPQGPAGDRYLHFRDNKAVQGKEQAFLWVRATLGA